GYPCSSDKECMVGTYCHSPQHAPSRCLTCRRRKKRCHRDGMCCPGNRCSNYICIPISESSLSSHKSPMEEHNTLSINDKAWRKNSKPQAKISLKVSVHDLITLSVLLFCLSHRNGIDFSLHLQVTRATLAYARPTARRATAALATSGRKSASLCCGRAKFAPSSARKAPTAWRSSSAVTAPKDLPARCGKTPPPSLGPGCTCARGSETGGPCKTSRTLGPLRPSGRGVGEDSFLQDLLSCDKGRKGEIQMNVCQNRVGTSRYGGRSAVAVEEALHASFQDYLLEVY
ncbi:Dickkopf-related protein 2, partial [Anabarilius grahami]